MTYHSNFPEKAAPFDGCPKCGRTTGHLKAGLDNWQYCKVHQLAWTTTYNLFNSWREGSRTDWTENARIERYQVVRYIGHLFSLDDAVNPSISKADWTSPLGPEAKADLSRTLHIVHFGNGYHILQAPGPNGTPYKTWPGPFESELAADLFREDLIAAMFGRNPNDACCSDGIYEMFNLAARILTCIGTDNADTRALALKMALAEPWRDGAASGKEGAEDVPF